MGIITHKRKVKQVINYSIAILKREDIKERLFNEKNGGKITIITTLTYIGVSIKVFISHLLVC